MSYNNRIYWNKNSYGKVFIVKTLYVGLLLDLLVPFTFGMITILLTKTLGEEVRI